MGKGRRGIIAARLELGLAVLVGALIVLLWAMVPSFMGGEPPVLPTPLAIAAIGFTLGFVWMLRLARAHREPDAHHWRYRDD